MEPKQSATLISPQNASMMDRSRRAASVLSMDDLEAAQALEGLRSDFGQSPRTSRQSLPIASPDPPPEPLLSLLTSSHPLISSAISGSVSAYATSKSYSPRFKSGAEFIERNIGSPVANTVGTVGRKTGVESGLRWALQRRDSTSEDSTQTNKRRKMDGNVSPRTLDVERGQNGSAQPTRARSPSDLSMAESLPPYDEMRSPHYEEKPGRRAEPTWQSRLVISTSGLGVAMSDESLRSLQYCLTWLRWANRRLGKSIEALHGAVSEWENQKAGQQSMSQTDVEAGDSRQENASLLIQRIQTVKADVLSTLKQVVDIVSKYAGGALPENARHLVRRHLTSLPHRFQVASTSNPPPDSSAASSDAKISAHRILVLAQEGLDMMAQVSGVVNDTLVSAEHWCERLGRKRPENGTSSDDPEKQGEAAPGGQAYGVDLKPPILPENAIQDDVQMSGMEKA
ncbi:hypothetical protein N7452_010851 [Penicillium brevicompactum]|uniref:Clock controled protein n=1 Tax=Penicillium brevicompactum TaxID=5074 RepID=A0A9W9U704_PENBR|nr:hypothetical protein N7452_010851 [Penicillium brevicompactum]